MHTHGLDDDGLAFVDEGVGLGFGEAAGIAEAVVDFAEAVELGHVGGRGDDDHEEGVAHGGGAHVDDLHAAGALLFEDGIIVNDFVPAGHFLVGAELEAEELFGSGDFLGREGEKKDSDEE